MIDGIVGKDQVLRMNINISAMMEEYTQVPFKLWEAWHVVHPAGHKTSFQTAGSAFLFPIRGNAFFRLDKKEYAFHSGTLIHCCQGKLLHAGNIGDSEAEYYCLSYKPLASKEQAPYMHRAFDVEIGQNPRLITLLDQYIKLKGKPDADSQFNAKALIYNILMEVFISMRNAQKVESHVIVLEAKEYLDAHYMESGLLSDLSNRCGMSAKYFSEVFKKYTGISPTDYLIGLRLNQAYQLLMTTSCSIKEISNSIGYTDVCYFTRLFKKKYGIPPGKARQHERETEEQQEFVQ